jgi:hypothetical protein
MGLTNLPFESTFDSLQTSHTEKMLQIQLLGFHEFKLLLLYIEQFLRAPSDFRLKVLQNTAYILLVNIYYWTHITCTANNVGKSVKRKVFALRKASLGR